MALPPPDERIDPIHWSRVRTPYGKRAPKPPRPATPGLYVQRPKDAKDFRCALDAAISQELLERAHALGVPRERLVHDVLTMWIILSRQLESELGALENPDRIMPNLIEPYEGYGDRIALRRETGIETL